MTDAVIDNDAIIKLATYDLLEAVGRDIGGDGVQVLEQARYVVRDRLTRASKSSNSEEALERFDIFLREVGALEISEDERDLATAIEEAALEVGEEVDTGESQLCAVAILRSSTFVVTGDKRAMVGLQNLLGSLDQLAELRGRLVCLEQVVCCALDSEAIEAVKARICAEPKTDKTMSICFSCVARAVISRASVLECLGSYIEDLRAAAPDLLCEITAGDS